MQAQFRAWTVALIGSALVLIVAPHSVAGTSLQSTMQQEITKQQVLMTDGSQKILGPSKEMQEVVKILETKKDYAKARQMITEADKTEAEGEKVLAKAQRTDTKLLKGTRRVAEASRNLISGLKLMRNSIAKIVKDETALSRDRRIMREGHGILERGREILTTAQL